MRKSKILYSCGVIISILIIIAVIFFISAQKNSNKQIGESVKLGSESENSLAESVSSTEDKTVDEVITEEIPDVEPPKTEISKTISTQPNKQVENKKEKTVEEQNTTPTFVMPVEGEIIRNFAKDKLVYSDTLKEWVTHLGIDIKSPKTSIVKSSEAGKITAIKNDPRFGLSVVIEHQSGYTTIYSNLLTAEFVTVGEKVKKGQTIGTVGNTAAFEILDEPHLHFEILKDGNQIDPNMYL